MGLQSLPSLSEEEKEIAAKVANALRLNHTGKALAISNSQMTKALANIGHKVSGAVMRKMINYLRHKGRPICSDSNGYWWAANKDEIKECINSLQDRMKAQLATLNQLKEIYTTF